MKKTILSLIFLVSLSQSAFAQPDKAYYLEKYYLDVPVLQIPEFLEMHKLVTDASMTSEKRTLIGHYVARHMYAGKASIVMYDTYESLEDKQNDDLWGALYEHASSMTDSDSVAFVAKAQTWFRLFLEGHTDEIRVVRPTGFGAADWQSPGVIVLGYYTPKWADMNTFAGYWKEMEVANEKCGYMSGSRLSTHYSGSGPTIETASFYDSWDAFASHQKEIEGCRVANIDIQLMTNYWSIAGEHWDEIYIPAGSVVNGVFELSQHFK
ncbi:MAG: hypothetical protein ACO4AV_15995 [bacterium]